MHAVPDPGGDFRRAAGQRDWAAAAAAAAAEAEAAAEMSGSGLYEVDGDDPGRRWITNVRKLAGRRRRPRAKGSVLIGTGGWLLALLGAGLFYVSFSGQRKYIFNERHEDIPSIILAGSFDVAMVIFTVLALGLARAGKPARTERMLILACAFGSAGMNYAAADTASVRSVIAYVSAPVLLAVVVDRVVAVIRRHVLGEDEPSPWAPAGRVLASLARAAGLVALYGLRFCLAAPSTARGLRQVVLVAAPLPEPPVKVIRVGTAPDELDRDGRGDRQIDPPGGTKKARLLAAYRDHKDYGNPDVASKVAGDLAAGADLQPGSARTYIYEELRRIAAGQNGATS